MGVQLGSRWLDLLLRHSSVLVGERETDDSSSQVVVPLLCVRNFFPLCSSLSHPSV